VSTPPSREASACTIDGPSPGTLPMPCVERSG
jgi:hypothetical protein